MILSRTGRTTWACIGLLLILPILGACGGSSTASAKNSGPVWGFPFKTGTVVTLGSFGLHDDNYGSIASSNGTFFFDGAGTVMDASLDLLPQGSSVPVIPLASGTVFATWPMCHLAVVDHGGGVLVEYLHINVSVKPGVQVTRDTTLGTTTTSVSKGQPCNEVSEGANGQPVEHVHFAFLTKTNATPPYSASNTVARFETMVGRMLCGHTVAKSAPTGFAPQGGAIEGLANGPDQSFTVPDCPSSSGQVLGASTSAAVAAGSPLPVGTSIRTYKGHSTYVFSAAWSPDGTRIVSADESGSVQVWDATTGTLKLTYQGDPSGISAVAWSPDGSRIALTGSDYSSGTFELLTILDAAKGNVLTTCKAEVPGVGLIGSFAVAWSPDSKKIAFARALYGDIQLCDAATGDSILTHHSQLGVIKGIAWSPDGKLIASAGGCTSCNENGVEIWNAVTGDTLSTYQGHASQVESVVWSPDGKRIASGGLDHQINIWDATTGDTILTHPNYAGGIEGLSWSPDGTRIASGSVNSTVEIWSVATGISQFTYHGHSNVVDAVAWSPDGTRIASASYDGTVQVWSAG